MHRLTVVLASGAVIACAGRPSSEPNVTRLYDNPERVTVFGDDDDAMEPFITRIDDVTFRYRGKLDGPNTPALEGVATMDRDDTLYFVSTRSYGETLLTIFRGRFANGKVTGVELVPAISRKEAGIVNFDVDMKYTTAVFVGEATSSHGNHFGDSYRIVMPNSRVTVRVSTLWHQYVDSRDKRMLIQPGIAAPLSFAEYVAGRDPALEAVFHSRPSH